MHIAYTKKDIVVLAGIMDPKNRHDLKKLAEALEEPSTTGPLFDFTRAYVPYVSHKLSFLSNMGAQSGLTSKDVNEAIKKRLLDVMRRLVFIAELPFEDVPLYVGNKEYEKFAQWRLTIEK